MFTEITPKEKAEELLKYPEPFTKEYLKKIFLESINELIKTSSSTKIIYSKNVFENERIVLIQMTEDFYLKELKKEIEKF
jgi:hypothetical protein